MVSDAPEAVQAFSVPVSKSPFVNGPPPPPSVALVSVTVVECLAKPSSPLTVIVYTPAAAVPAFTVRVELPPAATEVGLTEAVAPLGVPDTTSDTVPWPDVTSVKIVLVPLPLRLGGDALMLKSFKLQDEVIPMQLFCAFENSNWYVYDCPSQPAKVLCWALQISPISPLVVKTYHANGNPFTVASPTSASVMVSTSS